MGAFVASLALNGASVLSLSPALPFLMPSRDGHESWSSAIFGFSRSRFWSRAENAQSQVPLAADQAVCVADSRLDHREQLLDAMGIARRDLSDAQIILLAHRKWGTDCVNHLRGDFGFVVWQPDRRELFGAADPFGCRALRFRRTSGAFIVGSRSRAVAVCADAATLNARYFRDYLRGRADHTFISETPYEGVERLPPGHRFLFSESRFIVDRYYRIDDRVAEDLPDESAYVARFAELLSRSVQSHLVSDSPVGISLSGGLDSSSVASLAGRHARSGMPHRVYAYSLTFTNSPDLDESIYQNVVRSAYPELECVPIPAEALWHYPGQSSAPQRHLDEIDAVAEQRNLLETITARAAADGARRMLWGTFSDQLIGSRAGWVFVADASLSEAVSELRRLAKKRGWKWSLLTAILGLKWRWFPSRRLRTLPASVRTRSLGSSSADASYLRIFGGDSLGGRLAMCNIADNAGLEMGFPFLDRDLVEFTLKLPRSLRLRGPFLWQKYILRTAMRGVVPEQILERTTWPQWRVVKRILANDKQRLMTMLRGSEALKRKWLPRRIVLDVKRASAELTPMALFRVMRVLNVDFFLRHWEER